VNGLLVPPHDPARIAEALRRLLRDVQLRGRLGQRGREILTEKYCFDVFERDLAEILEM